MMIREDAMDPDFRARLRADLVRRAREGDASASADGARAGRHLSGWLIGSAAAGAVIVAVIGAQLLAQARAEAPEAAPSPPTAAVLCADGTVVVSDGQPTMGGVDTAVESGEESAQRMLAACGDLWAQGALTSDMDFQLSRGSRTPGSIGVPQLTLCTDLDGEDVVVPYLTCDEIEERLTAEVDAR